VAGDHEPSRTGNHSPLVPILAVAGVVAAIGAVLFAVLILRDSGSPSTDTTTSPSVAAPVPGPIASSGKLAVAVNVPYPPNEFKDPSGKIVGFEIDLMDAVASALGLTAEYHETEFAKIIPSVMDGTFDVGVSGMIDTKQRQQIVDFVDYYSAGTMWAQRPGALIDPNNACGVKVAVQATTFQDTVEIPAKSDACVKAGKPPIDKVNFDRQDDATNALVLGEVDAMSADSPVIGYSIKQSGGKLEAAGEIFDLAPYGWPVAKGSPLAQSLQQALEHLIQTGQYQTILSNWGVESGAIGAPVINGAVS
jgi:polar amino acid transport system substrate-binding protein